jgi:hypothetical protein
VILTTPYIAGAENTNNFSSAPRRGICTVFFLWTF